MTGRWWCFHVIMNLNRWYYEENYYREFLSFVCWYCHVWTYLKWPPTFHICLYKFEWVWHGIFAQVGFIAIGSWISCCFTLRVLFCITIELIGNQFKSSCIIFLLIGSLAHWQWNRRIDPTWVGPVLLMLLNGSPSAGSRRPWRLWPSCDPSMLRLCVVSVGRTQLAWASQVLVNGCQTKAILGLDVS